MYARLHSLREESVRTVRLLNFQITTEFYLYFSRQVSQIEASGGGSSGRSLFDDVISDITLQQLKVFCTFTLRWPLCLMSVASHVSCALLAAWVEEGRQASV
jgi:hypothetical protein